MATLEGVAAVVETVTKAVTEKLKGDIETVKNMSDEELKELVNKEMEEIKKAGDAVKYKLDDIMNMTPEQLEERLNEALKKRSTDGKSDADESGEKQEVEKDKAKEGTNESEKLEYDEDGFRPLTEDEKKELMEKLGWKDNKEGLQGCKINDEGVIRYPCKNRGLDGKEHPETGVKYEKCTVEINGYKVEVVMPKFESEFDINLPENLIQAKDKEQFCECNKQLYEAIQENPELAKKFTPEQIEQIKDGITNGGAPDGYTWHHDAQVGKMQLVDSDIHAASGHTGGNAFWGGGIR
jgi:hypothetical protein